MVVVVLVAVPLPAGVFTVVDLLVSVVELEPGVLLLVAEDGELLSVVVFEVEVVVFEVLLDVSGDFSFTTVVEWDVPELAGVVETSVLQPARPSASRRATA